MVEEITGVIKEAKIIQKGMLGASDVVTKVDNLPLTSTEIEQLRAAERTRKLGEFLQKRGPKKSGFIEMSNPDRNK